MPACSTPSSRHTARSACLPGSSEPSSSCAAEAARAAHRGQPQPVARAGRGRALPQPRQVHRLPQLDAEPTVLIGRRAVDAEPDRGAGVHQVLHPRDARAQPGVRRRAVRDAGAGGAEPGDRAVGEVDAVRQPDVVAEPAESARRTPPACSRARRGTARSSSTVSARWVCSRTPLSRASSAACDISSVAHGERRARADRHPHERTGRRVVVAVDGLGGGGERLVRVLHDGVRRQAALGLAAVHRPADRVQPDADLARRLDDRGEQVARAAREDVVVVGRGRAAGRREAGQPRERGSVGDLVGRCRPTPGTAR